MLVGLKNFEHLPRKHSLDIFTNHVQIRNRKPCQANPTSIHSQSFYILRHERYIKYHHIQLNPFMASIKATDEAF